MLDLKESLDGRQKNGQVLEEQGHLWTSLVHEH